MMRSGVFGTELLTLIYLIGRYLRSTGNPSLEKAGRQMEEDVEDLVSGAWRLFEGCILGACALVAAIGIVVMIVRAIGWVLGF